MNERIKQNAIQRNKQQCNASGFIDCAIKFLVAVIRTKLPLHSSYQQQKLYEYAACFSLQSTIVR